MSKLKLTDITIAKNNSGKYDAFKESIYEDIATNIFTCKSYCATSTKHPEDFLKRYNLTDKYVDAFSGVQLLENMQKHPIMSYMGSALFRKYFWDSRQIDVEIGIAAYKFAVENNLKLEDLEEACDLMSRLDKKHEKKSKTNNAPADENDGRDF